MARQKLLSHVHPLAKHALLLKLSALQRSMRRMQLARRTFAKHLWTIATFNNLVAMYEAKGIQGVIDNGIAAPLLELCPPLRRGSAR